MTSTFVEDLFDEYDLDFLDNGFSEQSELVDCYLSEEALRVFLTPPQETWRDFLPDKNEAVITMDSSKDLQWKLAKEEVKHIRKRMMDLLSIENFKEVQLKDIMMFCIGPQSKIGLFLQAELGLDELEYLQLMSTVCIQAAYRTTSIQLFHPESLLKNSTIISESAYNQIWKNMSEKKRLPPTQISTSRRERPLWESLELITNELLRSISIVEREGRISVALDDDKIWMRLSDSVGSDLFNLKYTTHVKANRKGIIAHTAVTTGVNMPLGITFERSNDSTLNCFRRTLDFLFSQDGFTNLRNVSVHSDRGYMIPNLVFEYLISAGAEVVGTCKRMAQCWPFTYDQTPRGADIRTVIDTKGAPTLYLKWCKAGHKYLFASAFRNGTGRVATAISTMHTQHQWEGIVSDNAELLSYKRNSSSLLSKFFTRITEIDKKYRQRESEEEREKLQTLLDYKIEPFTLRQGEFEILNWTELN